MGGVVIVMRRVETGERHVGEVPLELFQGEVFKGKAYLEKAAEVVLEGVEALGIGLEEAIHICRGFILTEAREALRSRGHRVIDTKIEGATQALAEGEFIKSLVRLGVGDEGAVAEMRSFDAFLNWVLEDLGARERFVKTGWSSWPRLKGGQE